jgi:hypothetical protein
MAKKRKKKKKTLEKVVCFRVTKAEMSTLKVMARMYAGGNMAKWLRHCITDYTPKILKKEL